MPLKHKVRVKLKSYNGSWDNYLTITPKNSQYYALCIKQYGKKEADRIWKLRYDTKERSYIFSERWCKDINKKVDKYLNNKQVILHNIWTR